MASPRDNCANCKCCSHLSPNNTASSPRSEKQFTRLDASVAALKRARANLKRCRASVLKAACEGKQVPTEAVSAYAEDRDYDPAAALLERILAERMRRLEVSGEAPRQVQGTRRARRVELPGTTRGMGMEQLRPNSMLARRRNCCCCVP